MTPTTERVPSGNRSAALVAVGVVAVLAVLIARPWDPRPAPSPVAVVDPTPPEAPIPSPLVIPTLPVGESPPPFVLPTPDIAPPGPGGEAAIVLPADVAVVQCDYGRRRGERGRLAAVEVQPPLVLLDPEASTTHISRIGWRIDVETIQLQHIFDRQWQPLHHSAWQVAPANNTRPAAFQPLRSGIGVDAVTDTAAVRVRIVVEWYTRNDEVAGRAELMPHTYREADAEFDGAWSPFCRAVL